MTCTKYRAVALVSICLIYSGCTGIATEEEISARSALDIASSVYKPSEGDDEISKITEETLLPDLMEIAIRRSPRVTATYFEWAASVHRITVERSMPDPRLMFESDIQDVVMSLMPGLMVDIPGPGKLGLRGAIAAGDAGAKHAEFRKAVLESAADLKKAYFEIEAVTNTLAVNNQTVRLLAELKDVARSQYSTGRASLQDVLRADIELEELIVRVRNLEDSLTVIAARYRSALGVDPYGGVIVPLPRNFARSAVPALEDIYESAVRENPTLAKMEGEIRSAEAAASLARKSALPDFQLGVEADVKPAQPILIPQFSISLPIWRDKISAEIQSALASKDAAKARLREEELALAIQFASTAFMFRESDRELRSLEDRLIPNARSSLEVARSGYIGGQSSFVDYLGAEQDLLRFQLARIEARKNREFALADLSLTIAGEVPIDGWVSLNPEGA